MDIWKKANYIKDLKFLHEIILNYEVLGDFKGLVDLIEVIEKNTNDIVDYNFSNFSIYLKGSIAGAVPKDLHYCKIDLENRLALKDSLNSNIDPLFKYTLDLKVSLYKSNRDTNKEYCSTWHLDREDREDNFSYVHPYYHFQFGGKKLEYLDPNMAILSSPRIPHPPMDVILAFHFIINNFVDRKRFDYVDKIKTDPTYIRIITNSKKRLWISYFEGLSFSSQHDDYKIERLFPLYS